MKTKTLLAAFLITAAVSFSAKAEVPSFVEDITCPPPPSFSTNSCEAVCPDGYVLSPDYRSVDWRQTGLYACIPKDTTEKDFSDLKYCYYHNPYCSPDTVRGAVSQYVEKQINYYLPEGNQTYIDEILQIATLDPKFADKEETAAPSDLFLFFHDSFKVLQENADVLAYIYFALMSLWITAFVSAGWLMSRGIEHPAVYALRFAAGIGFFLVPVVSVSTSHGKVYQPAVVYFMRKAVYLGNTEADKIAQKLNGVAIKHMLTYSYWNLSSFGEKTADELTEERKIIDRQAQQIKWCKALWGGDSIDFLVPDDVLQKYTFTNDTATISEIESNNETVSSYSRIKCREIEKSYKVAVADYNKKVALLTSVKNVSDAMDSISKSGIVEEILKSPDAVSEDEIERASSDSEQAKILKQIKVIALYQKRLGWISYPLITLPILEFNKSLNKLTTIINVKNPGLLAKVLGYLAFPPGNMILSTMVKIMSSKGMTILSAVGGAIGGGIIGTVAAVFTGTLFTLWIAYLLTDVVLNVLPVISLVVAMCIRFVFYFVEMLKMIIVAPFVSAFFVSVKRVDLGYRFLGRIFFLAMYPIIFLIAAFVSYGVISLSSFLVYDMPIRVFIALKNADVINIFIFWVIDGMLFWLKTMVSAYLAFKIVMKAPEMVLEMLGLNEFVGGQAVSSSRELTEQLIRKTGGQV